MRAQCVFPFEVKRNTLHPKRFQKVFTWLCIQTMTTDMRGIHSVSESRVHVRYLPQWLVSSIRVQPCRACVLYDAYLYAQSARLCMTFQTTKPRQMKMSQASCCGAACRGISAFQMHFSLMKTQPICDWPGFQSTQIYV